MPHCTEARKDKMLWAIWRGKIPYQTASNRTILQSVANRRQRRYVVLADAAGRLTAAGDWYYDRTGAPMPRATYKQDQEQPCRCDEPPTQSPRSAAGPDAPDQ